MKEQFQQEPIDFDPPDEDPRQRQLQDALEAYNINIKALRLLVAANRDLNELLRYGEAPEELVHLMRLITDIFRPTAREQIKSPADAAALLMAQMGHQTQEQFRVLLLDTKNRIQKNHLIYQGTRDTVNINIGEVFTEPIRLQSASIIISHCHPSGFPDPSPEDIRLTREVVRAGDLLSIPVLDHIIAAQGKWISLKELGLGFS